MPRPVSPTVSTASVGPFATSSHSRPPLMPTISPTCSHMLVRNVAEEQIEHGKDDCRRARPRRNIEPTDLVRNRNPRVGTDSLLSWESAFQRARLTHNVLVVRMLELIHSRFAEPVTLPVLGASLGRQSAYLGGLFHRELGVTVREYVTNLRLKHASELVRDGVKIDAVALLVGYRSKKNFYWRFKQFFGTTPGAYRKVDPGRHLNATARLARQSRQEPTHRSD
jgi:transcriptional regulator GlxA family with amidase domain